jgi:hypothetical protein
MNFKKLQGGPWRDGAVQKVDSAQTEKQPAAFLLANWYLSLCFLSHRDNNPYFAGLFWY